MWAMGNLQWEDQPCQDAERVGQWQAAQAAGPQEMNRATMGWSYWCDGETAS